MNAKKIIISSAALLAIAAIVFMLYKNKMEIDKNKVVKSPFLNGVAVTTEKASRKEMDNQLKLIGTTIPIREAQAPAQAAGEITDLNFKIGDKVAKGAVLGRIDDKMKSLAVENAKIAVAKLETDMTKIKNMFEKNAATETQYRDIKFAYENAKNQLEQAKRQLEYTKIIAPFSGVVTQKNIEAGSYVNVGAPVCYLVDVSQLKVSLNVSENDAYKLKEGKSVTISSSVYPEAAYKGSISYISPKADKSHNYPIEVALENNKEYPLKSGTFVKVVIDFETKRNPLVIPRQALIGSINDAKVYVAEGGKAVLKKVTIGGEYDKYLEVLDGINEGDELITSGQVNLEDKMQIRIINN